MSRTLVTVSSLREPLIELLTAKLELIREDAALTIDHLIRSEQAGKSDHGLIRVPYLVSSGKFGPYGNTSAPAPRRIGSARLHVDGAVYLGYPVLHRLMEAGCHAVQKQDICIATSSALYPSGAIGDWVRLACAQGVATVVVANSPPRVAAPSGHKPIVGTNPISIGIPTQPLPFVSDSATSEITHGLLLLARASGKPLPPHAAVTANGQPALMAEDVDPARGKGAFLPIKGSHKAFSLAMGIELLASLGGGLPGGKQLSSRGVFCLFLSPGILRDVLPAMSEWLNRLDGEGVRIPGWVSCRRAQAQEEKDVIEVLPETLEQIELLLK